MPCCRGVGMAETIRALAIKAKDETQQIKDQTEKIKNDTGAMLRTIDQDAQKSISNLNNKTKEVIEKFHRAFSFFDFSQLNTVIGPLLISEGKSLAPEESARINDYDVQIQAGELLSMDIDPEIYVELGRYFGYKNDFGKALIRFDEALTKDSDNFNALTSKVICLGKIARSEDDSQKKQDLLDRANESLEKARPLIKPDVADQSFQFTFVEAWLLAENKLYKNAIKFYMKAKGLKNDPWIDYNLACIFADQNKLEDAMQTLERLKEHQNIIKYARTDTDFDVLKQNPTFAPRLMALGMDMTLG
jgi:tetratricopeptide (TPR) repeat protein